MRTIEGDIFNESNKGTFLTSLDNLEMSPLTWHIWGLSYMASLGITFQREYPHRPSLEMCPRLSLWTLRQKIFNYYFSRSDL